MRDEGSEAKMEALGPCRNMKQANSDLGRGGNCAAEIPF
jgi:hypothetical protein